jgi:hypothetical protein
MEMQRMFVTMVDLLHYNCDRGSSSPKVYLAQKTLLQLKPIRNQVISCHCTVASFGK